MGYMAGHTGVNEPESKADQFVLLLFLGLRWVQLDRWQIVSTPPSCTTHLGDSARNVFPRKVVEEFAYHCSRQQALGLCWSLSPRGTECCALELQPIPRDALGNAGLRCKLTCAAACNATSRPPGRSRRVIQHSLATRAVVGCGGGACSGYTPTS